MEKQTAVFTFRLSDVRPRGADTIVSIAPAEVVQAIFGGGGTKGLGGLARAFGGGIVFQNHETEEIYLGVWGRRNASRLRSLIRQSGYIVELIAGAPSGRVTLWVTQKSRPPLPTLDSIKPVDAPIEPGFKAPPVRWTFGSKLTE